MSGRGDIDDLPPGDRDAALAGEYALRLLDPAEEAACAAREAAEPGFAAEVARWRADLAPLDAAFAEIAPRVSLRGKVEARVFRAQPSALARLWGSAGLWRGLAAAATAVAVWLAVAPPRGSEAELAELLAAMAPRERGGEFVASYDPVTGTLSLTRLAGAPDPGRQLQVWALIDQAPVPLGVLPDEARTELVLPPELAARIGAGTLVEVSEEDPGGSPTGRPTPGAILAAGFLRDI